MNGDLMSLETLTISVADPYTQQEQADFDLWSVPRIQVITFVLTVCPVITNVEVNSLLSHSHSAIHHYLRFRT